MSRYTLALMASLVCTAVVGACGGSGSDVARETAIVESPYGQDDIYVARTHNDVDDRVRTALGEAGRLVLNSGPSHAGKTRTAFEGPKDRWPQARLAAPTPDSLAARVEHPDITGTDDALLGGPPSAGYVGIVKLVVAP